MSDILVEDDNENQYLDNLRDKWRECRFFFDILCMYVRTCIGMYLSRYSVTLQCVLVRLSMCGLIHMHQYHIKVIPGISLIITSN